MPKIDSGLLNPSWRGRKHAEMACSVGEMKKENGRSKMKEMHRQRVNQIIKSAEGRKRSRSPQYGEEERRS